MIKHGLDVETFAQTCTFYGQGDIIEFGTREGDSINLIAPIFTKAHGHIFAVDGFEGLPETQHGFLSNGVWHPGAFKADKDTVVARLSKFNNVSVIASWIDQLLPPSHYNIGPLVGANIDVDIYESTRDALFYLDKCEWLNNQLVVRFDDWDYHTMQDEVKRHNQAAYNDYLMYHRYNDDQLESNFLYFGTIPDMNNNYPYFATFLLKRIRNEK